MRPLMMPFNSKAFEKERKLEGRFKVQIWASALVYSSNCHHSMYTSINISCSCFSPSLVLLFPQWLSHLHSQVTSPRDLSCRLQDPTMNQIRKKWRSPAFLWEGSVMGRGQPRGYRDWTFTQALLWASTTATNSPNQLWLSTEVCSDGWSGLAKVWLNPYDL